VFDLMFLGDQCPAKCSGQNPQLNQWAKSKCDFIWCKYLCLSACAVWDQDDKIGCGAQNNAQAFLPMPNYPASWGDVIAA